MENIKLANDLAFKFITEMLSEGQATSENILYTCRTISILCNISNEKSIDILTEVYNRYFCNSGNFVK